MQKYCTSVIFYNTYTTHSVSYWRAKWPSVHHKLHKHQQLPTKLVMATVWAYSSVMLQTRLSPASSADPIWTRNEQQVQRHQAPEECLSPLMPAAKLQVAVDPFWSTGAQLRLHQRQLRKTGQSNGRMVSTLTHYSHRVCGQCMAPERIWWWSCPSTFLV